MKVNQKILERIPPQNTEAEQSVLGSMLLEKEAISKVIEFLKPEYFYHQAHQIIFSVIIDLFENGEPVDLITISEELRKRELLEKVGGSGYLTMLLNTVPTAANVEHYAKIIENKSILRRLIEAGTEIASMGYEEEQDLEEIIDRSEKLIFEISQKSSHKYFSSVKSVVSEIYDSMDKHYTGGGMVGIITGFTDLDRMTAGFQPSDLIIIAGRTSMGKTSLGINIAHYVTVKEKIPVAIFSVEMSKEQLVLRMLCSEGMVNAHNLRTRWLDEKDWPKLARAVGVLSEAPIYIDDTTNITVAELRGKARRLKAEVNIGMVIVDYLQLIQSTKKSENRVQEISEITRSLKSLARELKIPVVALSQLSREVEKQKRRPQLSDLRESGAIEQDSDVVIFVHREGYYKELKTPIANIEKEGDKTIDSRKKEIDSESIPTEEAEIIIAKQRNGPTGSIRLGFQKEYTRFVNLERRRKKEE